MVSLRLIASRLGAKRGSVVAMRTSALYSITELPVLDPLLLNVFPVPRLVVIGTKAKAIGVADEPLVDACLDLEGAV